MAKRLGTDSGSISRFETGKREPSLLEMLAYSNLAGVTINDLVDDKGKASRVNRFDAKLGFANGLYQHR